ncbi:MAG: hypothetical protein ABUK01_14705 [Leptospirales bacterium]
MLLSKQIHIRRRYSRSVNLERDLQMADSVLGYVVTHKGEEILERVVAAAKDRRSVSAYTLTGVYGTGKSAFAHFFSSLVAGKTEPVYKNAISILRNVSKPLASYFEKQIPDNGFLRAVVTASREPVMVSVLRALESGVRNYFAGKRGAKPSLLKDLETVLQKDISAMEAGEVLTLIQKTSQSAGGLLLIVDELGKTLEYAASDSASGDLYFLQQLAEMSVDSGEKTNNKIYFFGLLHQAFDEYAGNMTPAHRNEWAKVQGRFEDIPFYESPEETLSIMTHAMEHTGELAKPALQKQLAAHTLGWQKVLQNNSAFKGVPLEVYTKLYPLHPISARLLPLLCQKFAQNDRSLFTFLAGLEPHSMGMFLNEYDLHTSDWPSLKLHRLYDYFIESSGIGFRPGFQRWVEIQEKVEEARYSGLDHQNVIKTIGLLNLLSTGGALKSEKSLTILALLDSPASTQGDQTNLKNDRAYWLGILSELEDKGLIVYRKGLDEYRIWQGSDFNIEKAVSEAKQNNKAPLAKLLNENFYMRPLIAQKYSYETGRLRYFERLFIDSTIDSESLFDEPIKSDGLLLYYVDQIKFTPLLDLNSQKKPVLCLVPKTVSSLRSIVLEYDALKRVRAENKQLTLDRVAAKEVDQRIFITEKLLKKTLDSTFQTANILAARTLLYHGKKRYQTPSPSALNTLLSDLLKRTYTKGVVLHNELIHRSQLTTQGAKAQKLLMEAMFSSHGLERLGLAGYGPETSIFESLFIQNEIYIYQDQKWVFQHPTSKSGLYKTLKEVEAYCLKQNKKKIRTLRDLYDHMALPPYGVSESLMPLLFLLVLIQNTDSLSLYHNGSFVPFIGKASIELLLKRPENFSVKHFDIGGLKGSYFKELETVFTGVSNKTDMQNASLLQVVKPFIKFVKALPKYTRQTRNIANESRALMLVIDNAREPDYLLFTEIPYALGFINEDEDISNRLDEKTIQEIKTKLIKSLSEIQNAYGDLLSKCLNFIFHYFSISSEKEKLREELRVRARRLEKGAMEPLLKRFILAAKETGADDEKWLEALVMVIADKPAESFKDEDVDSFEMNITQIARRFQNLETLVTRAGNKGEGFEARKITITKPDGNEMDEVIWVDEKNKDKLNEILDHLLDKNHLLQSEKNSKALLSLLADRVLLNTRKDELSHVRETSTDQGETDRRNNIIKG